MLKLQANKPYHFLLVHCNDYKNGVSVILATQCIQSIVSHFPNSKVSFLLHSSMKDFFLNNQHLNQIFCIDTDQNIAKTLKRANINISISLVSDRQSTIALFRSGIKARIGVFSHLYSLLFNYKVKQKRSIDKKHEAIYNIDLLKFLQCKQFFYPKIYLKLSDVAYAQEIIKQKFGLDSIENKGYIVICPSHGLHEIGWKAIHFFTIANAIAPLHNVLLLAQEDEMESYKSMLPQFPNLSERNLFLQSQHKDTKHSYIAKILGLISLSRLFIANNNTLLHAAAALDVSTFGILPHKNSLSPYRYAPISQNKKHVVCTPFGIFKSQDSYENSIHGLNMDSITPNIVLSILQVKFFPKEKLFIQIIDNAQQKYSKDQNDENQHSKPSSQQKDNTKQDTDLQEVKDKEVKSLLDIQDSGFTNNAKSSIIDERG